MSMGKINLLSKSAFDSRVKSANVQNSERWLGFFLGPVGAAMLNITIVSYINVFYTDVIQIGWVWNGLFLTLFPIISKVIDAVTNIIMGQIIEHTHTKQGKARPWLLLSAPVLTISGILLFAVPRASGTMQIIWVFLSYNLFYSFAYTIYNMSHTLMLPLSTINVKQRDGLSMLQNVGASMIPGLIVSLLFPSVLLPLIGVDYAKWVLAMSVISIVVLPLTLVEYYFTKERVTEAKTDSGGETVSLREQLRACFHTKYWGMMIIIMIFYWFMTNMNTVVLPYFCNWVLGTYNDGTTQMILSAVGKAPLGFGVFILWPLVHKYGKRRVMIVGFSIAALGEIICWFGSHSMAVMLAGSFVYAIGFLPTYVITALMADALDYVEYEKGIRCDGLTASFITIIVTVTTGLSQGLLNLGLSVTGYTAPYLVSEGVYNVQTSATQNIITFFYIGVPFITMLVITCIMIFFRVEDQIPVVHETLTARRRAEAEARGEVYISIEEKAAMEQAENDRIAEEKRIEELKTKCAKKGLSFEEEETKYQQKLAEKKAKEAAKAEKKKK